MRLSADSKLRIWKKNNKPDLTMKKKSGEPEGWKGRRDDRENVGEKRGGGEGSERMGKRVGKWGKEGETFHTIELLLNADLKSLPDAIVCNQQKQLQKVKTRFQHLCLDSGWPFCDLRLSALCNLDTFYNYLTEINEKRCLLDVLVRR